MGDAVFRVTRIDLDGAEEVEAVHAIADDETIAVLRQLLAPRSILTGVTGRPDADPESRLLAVRIPAQEMREICDVTGKIPGDDPRYPRTTGAWNSLTGIINALMEEDW